MTIQMKATSQYFPVVLFVMLGIVVLTLTRETYQVLFFIESY